MNYFRNILVSVDQFLNVVLYPVRLGSGFPDETLSAYWARRRNQDRFADLASSGLDWIDADHAFDAIERNPLTGEEEPHHMLDYQIRRNAEEAALKMVLASDEEFSEVTMKLAEMGALRMRLREEARDRAARRTK
jgi:hypothetical protein